MLVINETREFDNSKDLSPSNPQWTDWKWQLTHLIQDIETFEQASGISFSPEEKMNLQETIEKFPMSITPYYMSLIDKENYKNDPVFKQAFPDIKELVLRKHDMEDPLSEDVDSPVHGITHRYPDRVLFHVSNVCAMYCRHCTRKRKVGDQDCIPSRSHIQEGLTYIRNTPKVRDVLLSGGDPFMLDEDYLDWILTELRAIPHVEVIRIGSRVPVVLPFKITDSLVNMLKKHHPVWVNTHFNHPQEITPEAQVALSRLANAGIPLGNQSVLLAGVNDCPAVMKNLVQKLVRNRVRPYYLYQCDLSEGLSHFRTPVGVGIQIMESLRGHTSGFAIPTYVVDAPGGGGKIPVMPNYLLSWSSNKVILRNYEGVITTYYEPENYSQNKCDLNCNDCKLTLESKPKAEQSAIGVQKLLSDYDDTISLTPEDNDRMDRRK